MPTTLAALEEAVRERLYLHGQHGAVALFNKYAAEVNAKLHVGVDLASGPDRTVEATIDATGKVVDVKEAKAKKPAKASKAKK